MSITINISNISLEEPDNTVKIVIQVNMQVRSFVSEAVELYLVLF